MKEADPSDQKLLAGLRYWELWSVDEKTDKPTRYNLPLVRCRSNGEAICGDCRRPKEAQDRQRQNYQAIVDFAKLCSDDKVEKEKLADGFSASPGLAIKQELYAEGEMSYSTKIFFVESSLSDDLAKLFKSNIKTTIGNTVINEPHRA